jgi:hypothetical protein
MPGYKIEWLNPERTEAIITETADKYWPWSRAKVRQAEVKLFPETTYKYPYWGFVATGQSLPALANYAINEKLEAEKTAEAEAKNWTIVSRKERAELPKAKVVQK